jgi:nucleoside-diphosphate-sugar epimerase
MRILVTGNLGYIGSVLSEILQNKGYDVMGYDIGYFKDCITSNYNPVSKQINKDLNSESIH